MKEEGDRFNFEKQRREVGLGENDNKYRAKKSGKSLSTEVPNPTDFFEEYESTLVRNREVEWLNGERDSPDPKVKKSNPNKKEHDLPAFWKKEGDSHQPSTPIQGLEVSSVVTARASGEVKQSSSQEAGIQDGMKMFNSILGQSPNVQTPKKELSSGSGGNSKADDESSNSTPKFKQERNDQQATSQPVAHGMTKIQAVSNIQNQSPLSRLSAPNQIPNPPIKTLNMSKPMMNSFMGPTPTTNVSSDNQLNVVGFNKQGSNGLSPKISNINQAKTINPQIFGMMKTVKLSHQKQGSAEVIKCANYRKLMERCTKYRQKIREMVKSSAGEKQKLIDIITLMTLDHPKPLERELIINKSEYLMALYEQIQQGKKNRWKQGNFLKAEDHIEDSRFPGFNLNDYLAHSQEYTVKKLAEVPQERMSQIRNQPTICKLYSKVQNMSCEQFAHKFSKMIEKMKCEMVANIEKFVVLLSSKRQAECLTLRCQQQQENIRYKNKVIQQQLKKIAEKQQYCQQFFAECCRYLEVQSPQQLPKQQLNYHLDSLQELTESTQRLKEQLNQMRAVLKQTSEGEPHRTITSNFCSFSRTLLQLLDQLRSFTESE